MKIPECVLVADRGELKWFELESAADRSPSLQLRKVLSISEARKKDQDRFSDAAGAFPNLSTQGQGNSTAERLSLEEETDLRIFRKLGRRMTEWLREADSPPWAFAAPAEINPAILREVEPAVRAKLRLNLPRDLVHASPRELLSRFQEAA
jgi:hypothetical protein